MPFTNKSVRDILRVTVQQIWTGILFTNVYTRVDEENTMFLDGEEEVAGSEVETPEVAAEETHTEEAPAADEAQAEM